MKTIIRNYFVFLVGLIAWVCPVHGSDNQHQWPEVSYANFNMEFSEPHETAAKIEIPGIDDKHLYLLECHLGPYETPEFDYSGHFECRLSSLYSPGTYSTLLTDLPNQSRDWESRGRFLIEEIMGKCAEYPEYGRLRHFRLRGMELTLEVTSLVTEPDANFELMKPRQKIKQLVLNVTVQPYPAAVSPIAERTNFIEPPYTHPEDPYDFSRLCDDVLTHKR
ncbi:MAG: hypothetical protein AB2L11_08330 [Syntrophobacteraceae bacterium]